MNNNQEEIVTGLTASQKYLPSKLLYDKNGLQLYSEIMQLPEYYLVNSEIEIFNNHLENIVSKISDSFNLVDLGAGNGLKTKILLSKLLEKNIKIEYYPIDIDNSSLSCLETELKVQFSRLVVKPKLGDYFQIMIKLKQLNKPKLVLFLGSSIGNYESVFGLNFLIRLNACLNKGDKLLIGFDLIKEPHVILEAYNDNQGITKLFNLNLLKRLNQEYDANFDLDTFIHYPIYDPVNYVAKSHLLSTKDQKIRFKLLPLEIKFHAWESILTESSQKYSKNMIEDFATRSRFNILENYYDEKHYYVISLWEVK